MRRLDKDGRGRKPGRPVPWTSRVQFSELGGRTVAYVPRQVLTTHVDESLAIAVELFGDVGVCAGDERLGPYSMLHGVPDPVALSEQLGQQGIVAQPNHVFFAHCGATCCPPHPALAGNGWATGLQGAPVSATPVSATPVSATPVSATPVSATPVSATPSLSAATANPVSATPYSQFRVTGVRPSSARPAFPTALLPGIEDRIGTKKAAKGGPKVIVLDTGLSRLGNRPATLTDAGTYVAAGTDGPDEVADDILDAAAGHGSFIAGVVNQISPGSEIHLHRVLTTLGDGDELMIGQAIDGLVIDDPEHTVLSLSFGGYVLEHPFALAWAIRKVQAKGVVVVASAGNDASCLPTFPAALTDVVSVGAVGPAGPALFTNYGPWVRACAPGVDLVSSFFTNFNGRAAPDAKGTDPDDFEGWAIWSGTSFSAPVVVGALARMMVMARCTAREAVERVIDSPWLMRIANLGTVVNVI